MNYDSIPSLRDQVHEWLWEDGGIDREAPDFYKAMDMVRLDDDEMTEGLIVFDGEGDGGIITNVQEGEDGIIMVTVQYNTEGQERTTFKNPFTHQWAGKNLWTFRQVIIPELV
jgi:hypothetical protein